MIFSVVKIPVIFVWVILPVLLRFFLVTLGNICKNIAISNNTENLHIRSKFEKFYFVN
jgi:hypothetical protein